MFVFWDKWEQDTIAFEIYWPLKIGTQKYLGQTIEVLPIKTTSALCYKVESKSEFNHATSLIISVVDLNRQKQKEDENFLERGHSTTTWTNLTHIWPPRSFELTNMDVLRFVSKLENNELPSPSGKK